MQRAQSATALTEKVTKTKAKRIITKEEQQRADKVRNEGIEQMQI